MKRLIAGWLAVLFLMAVVGPASAAPTIGMELNKLDSRDNSCRAYLVFENGAEAAYTKFKLDLILFDEDGIITKRVALDAAPVNADKTVVKVFDISDVQCQDIGRVLINEVLECATEDGAVEKCMNRIRPTTKAGAELSK